MHSDWKLTDTDTALLKQVKSFLPEKVFDAHAHVYVTNHYCFSAPVFWSRSVETADINFWKITQEEIFGAGTLRGGLMIPMPVSPDAMAEPNNFLLKQLADTSEFVGSVLISPEQSPDEVRSLVKNRKIAALKPYHLLAQRENTLQLDIEDFLPDWAWEIAQDNSLAIVLHLVKSGASADPGNSHYILEKCNKYPNVRLILAHCARGFCADTVVNGLPALAKLDNLWFDCSGICEAEAIEAVLWNFGPSRLMWGSDFPVSHQRARAVSVGDGFHWVEIDDNPLCTPTFTVIESLRALKTACEHFGLNRPDVNRIFYDNAAELFGQEETAADRTQSLYTHAKERIPGGVQLLSKRPEMMAPGMWPAYFSEARGCEVWDLDGKHYFDMSTNGIGTCLLGYRDPEVTSAVKRRINLGAMSTLNPPEEVYLADKLCEIHPWADKVRFARTGGECAAIAVRIARATTDRSAIAVCGYHGWQDWYLAANLGEKDSLRGHLLPGLDPLGVPVELRDTTFTFEYENTEQFDNIIAKAGHRLAAVIMEPCRYRDPEPGFLQYVRDACHDCGALLIFDEITIGWRYTFGGAHLKLGVNPDIAIFAKALGNGHPISAVLGNSKAMSGALDSFVSSTYWTESVGPAAALATLEKMEKVCVPEHVAKIGMQVSQQWENSATKHLLPIEIEDGFLCLAHFTFCGEKSNKLKTLFVQLMLEKGFLAGTSIYPTLAHTEIIVNSYAEAVDEVFAVIADIIKADRVEASLHGGEAHTGFRRLL